MCRDAPVPQVPVFGTWVLGYSNPLLVPKNKKAGRLRPARKFKKSGVF
jgi:hypothetical protein